MAPAPLRPGRQWYATLFAGLAQCVVLALNPGISPALAQADVPAGAETPSAAKHSGTTAECPQSPLLPSPSLLSITCGDEIRFAVGLGSGYGAESVQATEYTPLTAARFTAHLRKLDNQLFIEAEQTTAEAKAEAGWRHAQNHWLLQFSWLYLPRYYHRSDTITLQQGTGYGVVELRRYMTPGWLGWLGVRAEIGDEHSGSLGTVSAGYTLGADFQGSGTDLIIFARYADRTRLNAELGSADQLTLFSQDGHRSSGLQLFSQHQLSSLLRLTSRLSFEHYNPALHDSPRLGKTAAASATFTLWYVF